MNDILESLFQGMDILIDKKLEDVSFDSTIICTIVDDSRKKDGVYKVTDGNVIYTVYSENDKYSNEEQVRVSILNGDYSEKKFIVGKYDINSDSTPLTYVSPLESILNLSGNLIVGDGKYGITANGQEKERYIWSTSLKNQDYINLQRNGIYDSVFLKANFKTALQNYDLIEGNYGLRVTLMIKPNPNSDSYIKRWFELDSSEMLGNPYSFLIPSTQAKVVKLDTFGVVDTIALTIYQKGNFKDSEKEYIIPQVWDNILVSNIELGFGSDLASKEDNLLEIYTINGPTYKYANHNNDTNNKIMGLLWYNKDEHNQYIGFSDGIYDPGYDELQYLEISRMDDRLTSRMGREEVATDKESLTLLANIEEAEPLLKKALQVVDSDIPNLLRQLGTQMQTESNLFDPIDECVEEIGNLANSIKNTYIEELKKTYAQVLKYGYIIQTTGVRDGWIALTEDYGTKIQDTFDNIFNKVLTLLNSTLITKINSSYTEFLSIYDIFKPRIEKEILTAKEYLGQGVDEITGNPSAYNSKFPQSVLNKEDYNALLKYESVKNNFKSYQQVDLTPYENRYCIYWYRYNKNYIPPASEGGIMPMGWERMTELNNIGLPGQSDFKSIVNNIEISETEKKEYLDNLKNLVSYLGDKDNKIYYNPKPDSEDGTFNIYLKHDSTEEKFVAVLFYNHDRIQSRELVFTNADVVPDKTTLDKGDILIFEHKEQSYDDYQVYGITNYLMNASDEHVNRQLRCHYDGLMAKDEALVNAGIFWYVPTNSTMITVDEDYLLGECGFVKDGKILFSEDRKLSYLKEGYDCYYKQIKAKRDENGDTPTWNYIDDNGKDNRDFYYKIKPYYDHGAMQNSILCMVLPEGDPDPVYGEQFFTFGIKGTSGTKYTLSITNASSTKITTTNNDKLSLNVDLRDFDNKAISIYTDTAAVPNGAANGFKVDWFMRAQNGGGFDIQKEAIQVSGDKVTGIDIFSKECGIIKATASIYISGTEIVEPDDDNPIIDDAGQENKKSRVVDLQVLHNIPWSIGGYYLAGPTQIIYNSFGVLDDTSLFNTPYKLFNQRTNSVVNNVKWSIKYYKKETSSPSELSSSEKEYEFYHKYLPKLNQDASLTPSPIYLDGLEYYPVVIASISGSPVWMQPIIILQNRYSSSMLNDWDGTFNINEREGTIMSSMVGAGRKTGNNTFEGVLMGEVALKAGIDTNLDSAGLKNHSGLGVYGFHDGAQSFGFNVDGTAFLGKAGGGRIIFNGNYGVIASSNWFARPATNASGMLVDENGNSTDAEGNPIKKAYYPNPGGIINEFGVIQSPGIDGMCIDLDDGHIDAYNFRLTSRSIYFNSSPSWVDPENVPADWPTNKYSNDCYYMKIGNDSSFISLDSAGNLIMRANNFYLAGQSFGNANLLHQTSPRYTQLVLQTVKYQPVKSFDTTVNSSTGEQIISSVEYDTEIVNNSSQYNSNGNPVYSWDISRWVVSSSEKLLVKNKNGNDITISDTNEILDLVDNISLYLDGDNITISQTVDNLEKDKEYTMSGYIKSQDGAKVSILSHISHEKKYTTLDNVDNDSQITFEENSPYRSMVITLNDNEWHYFTYTFKHNIYGQFKFSCDKPCYLWHLKLEEGTVATAWCPSDQDNEDNAYGMQNKYDKYLKQDKLFDKLFTDPKTGQKIDGIALQSTGTPTGKPELYINATYIATGILRSKNWNGKLTAKLKDTENLEKREYEYTLSGTPTQGMYINLDQGNVWAATFELNAYSIADKKGLYLNSDPGIGQSFFIVGDLNNGGFINFANTEKNGITFSLTAGKKDTTDFLGLYSYDGISATIGSSGAINTWRIIAGNQFGVTKEGKMYASEATVSGILTAGAGSKIGGWTLTNSKLYAGGNGSGLLPVAMQVPSGTSSTVFAVGGKDDHSNYQDNSTKVFYVRADGYLYAKNATISGTLTAGSNSTIGNWKVTSGGNLQSSNGSVTLNGNSGAISGSSISGGSITIGTEGVCTFKVMNDGHVEMSSNAGFLSIGSATNHPRASALNLSIENGGLVFYYGQKINTAGTSKGSINGTSNGDIQISPVRNLLVGNYSGKTFQTIVQTSNMHYVYLKFYKGVCVGVSDSKDTTGTFADYSDSYDYV